MPSSPESPHILVVDDDFDIRESVRRYLSHKGHRVSVARNAKEAEQLISESHVDLLVLDVMMPGEDGLSLCRRLRARSDLPIILLTALTEDTDRVVGLEIGADDYVCKPFSPRELLARVRSVFRRAEMLPRRPRSAKGCVKFDRWRFNKAQKEVVSEDGVITRLSSGEHELLIALIDHAGVALTREQLVEITQGRQTRLFERSVDNHVSRLRRKLERDPKNPRIILTKWGGGYLFVEDVVDVDE